MSLDSKISNIFLYKTSYSPYCLKFCCHNNKGQSGVEFNWQHSMAHFRKPPYRRKNIANIFYTKCVIANFIPNFIATATGVSREKCDWQHSMAQPQNPLKTQKSRRYLLYKPSYSRFCPKIPCYGNGDQMGVNINVTVN